MKKIINQVKKTPIMIIFAIILLFFMPQNLAKSPEVVRNAVITMAGVDRDGEDFEITLLSFIPKAGKEFIETYEVTSTKANTLSQAFNDVELQLGKDVKLFHTEILVIGEDVLNDDVALVMDFFTREESISSSCLLIGTNSKAKEFLETLQKEDQNPTSKLSEIMLYNLNNFYEQGASIESFFRGYYSPTKASTMAYMNLNQQSDAEVLLNNPSQAESGQQQQQKQAIENTGEIVIFKNGKKVDILSKEVVEGANWINSKTTEKNLVIENFSDDEVSNATIVYYLNRKDVIKSVYFQNETPVFLASIRLHIDRVEIFGEKKQSLKNIHLANLSEEAINRIQNEVKTQFATALEKLRSEKCDIMGIYREFYNKDRSDFVRFLDQLEDKEDFLNHVIFGITIDIVTD